MAPGSAVAGVCARLTFDDSIPNCSVRFGSEAVVEYLAVAVGGSANPGAGTGNASRMASLDSTRWTWHLATIGGSGGFHAMKRSVLPLTSFCKTQTDHYGAARSNHCSRPRVCDELHRVVTIRMHECAP